MCLLLMLLAVSSHPLSSANSAVSICHLIQLTNVGENYQWGGSARPFHPFSSSEPGDQFSMLRELQLEPSGT